MISDVMSSRRAYGIRLHCLIIVELTEWNNIVVRPLYVHDEVGL